MLLKIKKCYVFVIIISDNEIFNEIFNEIINKIINKQINKKYEMFINVNNKTSLFYINMCILIFIIFLNNI